MSESRYCLVCGASSEEVGDGVPTSTCPLELEDLGEWWNPTWEELNCLETLAWEEECGRERSPSPLTRDLEAA